MYYDLIEIRKKGTIEDKEDRVPENINDYVTNPDYSKYVSAYLTVRNENRSVTLTDDFSEQHGYYSPVKRQLSCTTKATPYLIFKKIKEEDFSGVKYQNGDDISENTYLCSVGKRMRVSYNHIYTETGSNKFNEETGMNEIVADLDSNPLNSNPLTYELVSYVTRKAYANIIGQSVEEVKWEWLEPKSETSSTSKTSEKL